MAEFYYIVITHRSNGDRVLVVRTETVTMPLSRDVCPLEMHGNNIFEGTIITVSVQTSIRENEGTKASVGQCNCNK